jgi:uncharacterized protein
MNFDVIKKIMEYARSLQKPRNKNFRFTITTNGLLLDDEKIDFINQEMSNVVLSLDGRKATNDRLRVTNNAKGSYDIIVPKFQKLVNSRGEKDYYVRGTFTKYNLDFTNDILHLAGLGFKKISVEPVISDKNLDYSIKTQDLPQIFEEYEKLLDIIIKDKELGKERFSFFHFQVDLDQGPCAIKRLRGCGCGNEYIAVTPEGDLYPCHQFVGEPRFLMGNLLDGTFCKKAKETFANAHIYSKKECRTCWAKFYCSGGCSANSWQYEGDILAPHKIFCELQKKRLECAIRAQCV